MRPSSLRSVSYRKENCPMSETLLDYAINPTPYPTSDFVVVCVIDKNSHPPVRLFQTLTVGKFPGAIAASPDGQFIFVAKFGSDETTTISVVEPVVVSM
jgi:hypothetical protein